MIVVERSGPAISVQDAGRTGGLGLGLSRGGAADRHAYLAACALAGAEPGAAAIEMAGLGGRFRFETPCRFALAGAKMRATLDAAPLTWNAAHHAEAGTTLDIGPAESGIYGYVLPGGGIETDEDLGGRGYHRIAGLGKPVEQGDRLPVADNPTDAPPMRLPETPGETAPISVMPGPQTAIFDAQTRNRFETTTFTRSPKANRQGVRLEQDGPPFSAGAQLQQVSDFISEGDIQLTGDGTPYVLLADCQTMGGYPRIGTVLPVDLPRIAQATPGAHLTFRFVTVEEAEAAWQSDETILKTLRKQLQPLIRDPRDIPDLLSYDLVGKPLGGEDSA